MIHSWKTNIAGQDEYNGYPSQVVHDHWNPNETCISFPWSKINKLPLEHNAAVLRNGAVMDIQWCHAAPHDPVIHPWKITEQHKCLKNQTNLLNLGLAWESKPWPKELGNPTLTHQVAIFGVPKRTQTLERWITKYDRWGVKPFTYRSGESNHTPTNRVTLPLNHDNVSVERGSKNI